MAAASNETGENYGYATFVEEMEKSVRKAGAKVHLLHELVRIEPTAAASEKAEKLGQTGEAQKVDLIFANGARVTAGPCQGSGSSERCTWRATAVPPWPCANDGEGRGVVLEVVWGAPRRTVWGALCQAVCF